MSLTPPLDQVRWPATDAREPTVFVVDDDEGFSASITRMLRIAGFRSLSYGSVGEFLLAQSTDSPGCILLDISMPGPSGIEMFEALLKREIAPPVIFVTARDDVPTTVNLIRSGALDYLVKPVAAERLLGSVRRALQVDAGRRAVVRERIELRMRFKTLSATERAIFDGIVRHRLNKQLAADLGVCERTIKAQRARMMEKLELVSVPDLVRAASLLDRGASQPHARSERVVFGVSDRELAGSPSASLAHQHEAGQMSAMPEA